MDEPKERAINDNKSDTKRRIDFKDGNVTIIEDNDDIEHILITRNEIFKRIKAFDFDALRKIELINVLNDANFFGNTKITILVDKTYLNKIFNNLRNKLQENIFSMNETLFRAIVDEYVCDFLSLDHSFFDNYHNDQKNIIKLTKDIIDVKESEESVPTKLESKVNDKTALGVECIPQQLEKKINDKVALFENIAIYEGKNNLLYGGSKVGKSYFSIEVAKNENIKKPYFILLEDYSGDQEKRYSNNLATKQFTLFNLNDFEETYNEEKEKRKKLADNETIKDFYIQDHRHIKILFRQNYVEMGVIKNKNEILDRIAVIEKIIDETISNGADFICIDSLHALIEENPRSFNLSQIKKIIEPISKKHITFLLINHTTKDRKTMAFTNELINAFDNIYKLEIKEYISDNNATIILTEENARDNVPHIITIERILSDNYIVKHGIICSDILKNPRTTSLGKNETDWIKEIINSCSSEYMEYKELVLALEDKLGKKNDEANIKKILKRLQDENVIAMKDGSTWVGGIKII